MKPTISNKEEISNIHNSEMMEIIHTTFPEILKKAPKELLPLHCSEDLSGLCNHPSLFNPNWVTAFGEQAFKSATGLPEGFFAYGYKESYSSAFFVMWQEKGRRFWMFEHCCGLSSSSAQHPENTRNHFLIALKHWEQGGYRKPKFA